MNPASNIRPGPMRLTRVFLLVALLVATTAVLHPASAFEDAAAYGPIDASVAYPKDLEVDYVRVFERAGEGEAGK